MSLHGLRATAATSALEHQADIARVQEWLDYACISTPGFVPGAAPGPRTGPRSRPPTVFEKRTGRGHALVNDLWIHRFLYQGLAAVAGPLAPNVVVHEKLSWDDVQALGHVFADTHHCLATTTGRVLWFMVVVNTFEVLGQGLAFGIARGVGVWNIARHLECCLQRCELVSGSS